MKKSIIATGAASLALAAMPLAGAFAANTITDTVIISIETACQVGSSSSTSGGGTTIEDELVNGATEEYGPGTADGGGAIYVSCNDSSGWHVTAVGSSDTAGGNPNTSMKPATTSTGIATNTSGDASYWAFKVTGTNTVATYNNYQSVPASAVKVAGNSAAVSEGVINTGYKVHISDTQAADTYTGRVTYTVSEGVGN